MFKYDLAIKGLEDFSEMKEKKKHKFLKNLLKDEEFISWLFCPPQTANLAELVNELYVLFTKPKILRVITAMIDEEGANKFDRSHATFLYSICNIAIQSNNERIVEINRQKKNGDISSREASSIMDKVDKYNIYIGELIKQINKIVKKKSKTLVEETKLPKYICASAYYSVPSPKYIDRYKVGYYLNNLLNDMYSVVDTHGEFADNVKWKAFFKEIFGENNVIEVATFILLEGVHRIDKYESSEYVKECWDSLTTFALKELNNSPENTRNQMIELYIKRIDKMFSNKAFDLRVNLLNINENTFPNLVATINGYADKIESILGRGR